MANTVKVKRSAVGGKVPLTTDLELGEIAVNTHDGKMFLKRDNGAASIVEVGPVASVAGRTGAVTLGVADVSGAVSTSRNISAGSGLTGGGSLAADRTISADYATTADARAGNNSTKLMTPALVASRVSIGAATGGNQADLTTSFQNRLSLDFTPNASVGIFHGRVRVENLGQANDVLGRLVLYDTVTGVDAATFETGETAPTGLGYGACYSLQIFYGTLTVGRLYQLRLFIRKTNGFGPIYPRDMLVGGFTI